MYIKPFGEFFSASPIKQGYEQMDSLAPWIQILFDHFSFDRVTRLVCLVIFVYMEEPQWKSVLSLFNFGGFSCSILDYFQLSE